MTDDASSDEFDTVARWTADAVRRLGPAHAIPGACRGSGGPGALDWFLEALDVQPGERLLDAGAGLGGPAAYAADRAGARPVLVDPMAGACQAARDLFGLPVAVAPGEGLPVADGSCAVVWSLGVLSTVDDQAAVLAELQRVLAPGGRLGFLAYLRTVDRLADEPEGNHFPSVAELDALLGGAGLAVVARTTLDDVPEAGQAWDDLVAAVDAAVAERHDDDERWRAAREDEQRVGDLIGAGRVVGHLLRLARA